MRARVRIIVLSAWGLGGALVGGQTPFVSRNNTHVPPAAEIVTTVGDVWTIAPPTTILRNGSAANGGTGTELWWLDGQLYAEGTNSQWYRWATAAPMYLSDRAWTAMTNGYGPVEKDLSNGENGASDGRPLTLNGVVYPKGLGAHAPAEVRYALDGTCSLLTAAVGVDDEVGDRGSVVFQVWVDGVQQYDSGRLTGTSPTAAAQVRLTGAKDLALIVTDAGDGFEFDHADWANARIYCGIDGYWVSTSTPIPAIVVSRGARFGFTQVAPSRTDLDTYTYQYSVDGEPPVAVATPVTCTGPGPYACVTAFPPAVPPGMHSFTLTASNMHGPSPPSDVALLFVTGVPAPAPVPIRLRTLP